MSYAKKSFREYNSSILLIEHEIITLLQKLDWIVRGVYALVQKEDKTFPLQWEVYNLSRQRCQRSRSNYRYKEIEEGESSNSIDDLSKMQSTECTCPQQVQAIMMYQSLPKECVVKVVKEDVKR